MRRDISVCIYEVKSCLAKIGVEGTDNEAVIEEQTDRALRLLEWLDEQLAMSDAPEDDSAALVVRYDSDWHIVAEDDLPPAKKDLLFTTKCGKTYEGFLVRKDITAPYKTEDGKLAFREYPDGGKWFRYHFRDLLDMKQVIAWSWKPVYTKH